MENGAASGGIERDALFNREMRTCWSVREGSTEERGALKAQSGYNSGQGRKAAVSKPPRILREETFA